MELYNLNIEFKYNDQHKFNEDDIKISEYYKDTGFINNGVFNYNVIRNINFYKEYKKKYPDLSGIKAVNKYLKLPYTNNYVSLDNLNQVIRSKKKADIKSNNDYLTFLTDTVSIIQEKPSLEKEINNFIFDNKQVINRSYKTLFNKTATNQMRIFNVLINTQDIIKDIQDEQKFSENVLEEQLKIDNIIKLKNLFNNLLKYSSYRYEYGDLSSRIVKTEVTEYIKQMRELIYKLYTRFKKQINDNLDDVFASYKDENYEDFFLFTNESKNDHIESYFDELKDNFKQNEFKDDKIDDYRRYLPNYNTLTEFENILYYNSRYFNIPDITKDEYEKYKSNKHKFYIKLRSDNEFVKKVITYNNIYTILKEIYLIKGTIISIPGEFVINKKIKKNIYIKIKSISKIYQNNQKKFIDNNNNNINSSFYIEFEEIPYYSKVDFLLKFNDKLNLNNIDNFNKLYKRYSNTIYTDISNNVDKYIYIDNNINYNKIISNYKLLLSNTDIFKLYKPTKIKEIFMNKELFNYINNENNGFKLKNTDNSNKIIKDIKDYYVDRFFFKRNNVLKINNEYAEIQNVKMVDLCYNNIVKDSTDLRLAIDNVDINYEIKLDIDIIYKETKDEKINLTKRINAYLGCNNTAIELDSFFKSYFKQSYPEKYLTKKLAKLYRNKTVKNPVKIVEQQDNLNKISGGNVKLENRDNIKYKISNNKRKIKIFRNSSLKDIDKTKKNKTLKLLKYYLE